MNNRNCFHHLLHARISNVSRIFSYFFLSCVLATPTLSEADIYHFVAEDGTPHFSDQPSDARFRLILRTDGQVHLPGSMNLSSARFRNAKDHFIEEISNAARANHIEPALLHAVIEIESGYNAKAVSPKGALGLMQLMPDTARRYAVQDPLDAVQNLRGGARLLRDLLDLYSGNKELALAAYNAGAGAVKAHGGRIPPYAETERYVPAVMKRYESRKSQHSSLN